ncbi:iron ABC transporter permease [Alcaligenaceae bacterium]|nr:iron ABC transporter permease [Alcaligenaceae bacterium]
MWRKRLVWVLLCGLLLLSLVAGLLAGKYPMNLADIWSVLQHRLFPGSTSPVDPTVDTVVWTLRVPRMAAALLVGSTLAAAGAAYQGMFRNPLVSPDILGVSAGAGLGAVMGIYLSLPMAWVQMLAFAGGMVAVAVVYGVAQMVRRHDPILVLVLAGVALSAFLAACISLIKILADPYTQLPAITFWLLGGLGGSSMGDLLYALPPALLGLVPLWLLRWRINLLSLSDEEATSLGMHTGRMRGWLIVAATLMTASAVSFTGIVGWVGLVIPHMARLLVGPDFSRLLPASLLLGGAFLVVTDTLARSATSIELPLGVLTAMVGAPFFLFLLAKGGRQT